MDEKKTQNTPDDIEMILDDEFTSPDIEGIVYLLSKDASWTE